MTELPVTQSAESADAERRALGNDEADQWRWLAAAGALALVTECLLVMVLPRRSGVPLLFGLSAGAGAMTYAWLATGRRRGRIPAAALYGAAYGAGMWAVFRLAMRA